MKKNPGILLVHALRYALPERRGIASDAPTLQPRVVVAHGFARSWSVDRPLHVQKANAIAAWVVEIALPHGTW